MVRCWQPADAGLLKEAVDASLDHLRPWMPWANHEPTGLDAKIATLRTFRGKFDLGQDFVYGIFNREETLVLGGTGLHTRPGRGAREIGYWIRADAINRGLATEVAAALTRVAFEIDHVRRVEIHCAPDNVRSAAVPAKLGYRHEATLRGTRPPRGRDARGCHDLVHLCGSVSRPARPRPRQSSRSTRRGGRSCRRLDPEIRTQICLIYPDFCFSACLSSARAGL